jgi:predicted secreted protein
MNFTLYFFTFCFIWWINFFIVLPIGIEIEKKVEKGHADSAPKNPRMLHKILLTTLITLLLTIMIIYLVERGYLDHLISLIKNDDRHY